MSCDCSLALPHGTMGWSAVCDCGTSWSNLLGFFFWMDTGLDSYNTHRYVDGTKLSVSHSNMIRFTSGTCLYWL